MTPIIRKFVLKLLSKNRGSGIISIPGDQHRMIQESMIMDTLLKKGVDPTKISSEGMLQSILKGIVKGGGTKKAGGGYHDATVSGDRGRTAKQEWVNSVNENNRQRAAWYDKSSSS